MSEELQYVFRWETVQDERVCPICSSLSGREWRNQDLFQPVLIGDTDAVWDLDQDKPLTHPNCRCRLHVEVNIDPNKNVSLQRVRRLLHRIDC